MIICHVTSAHRRYSSRIFDKFCVSAVECGHAVTLIVADGEEEEVRQGVRIIGIQKPKGRWHRFLVTPRYILRAAQKINADVYQLHDPELMPIATSLCSARSVVIFDFHEDLPVQVLQKGYLKLGSKYLLSFLVKIYQFRVSQRIDGVICATSFISDKFVARGIRSVPVMNYPRLEVFDGMKARSDRGNNVVYVGAISPQRGITEIVKALEFTESDVRLRLAGAFDDPGYKEFLETLKGWQKVDYLGFLSKEQVVAEVSSAKVGLVTLHPLQNYVDALPIKMFEYMSLGTPVVSSNFPTWRNIIEIAGCGKVVDPLVPKEIALAIDHIVFDERLANKMGQNGMASVQNIFNWKAQEAKVIAFYTKLLAEKLENITN